jgi:type II secretory pathway component PulC
MRIHLSHRYVTALNFVLIAAIAYFAALSADDLIVRRLAMGSLAEPPAPAARRSAAANLSRASYAVIAERDVFNSVKQAPASGAPVAENLHIKLLGTSQLTAAKPFAITEDESSHLQALYRLGDEIPDAGTLVAVERKRVLINRQGRVVALEISDGGMPAVAETPEQSSAVVNEYGAPVEDESGGQQEDQAPVALPFRPPPPKKSDYATALSWKNKQFKPPARNSGGQQFGRHSPRERLPNFGRPDGASSNQ